ncbi:hypothetical protein HY570_03620 [Candidatus Micrarchaeota archaeon]|nr:hypothetical protein [Candidatus Micrarchaeota archaeon]
MTLAIPNTQKTMILARFANNRGFTAEQAVSEANKQGITLAPNRELDRRLLTDTWKREGLYPAWSGTLFVNVQPDVSFRDATKDGYIVYEDPRTGITYRLKVPEYYLAAINCILLVEHGFNTDGKPTFEIHKDISKERVIHIPDDNNLNLVENYPRENGWYSTDGKFGIPTGQEIVFTSPDARYLWRADKTISLAARDWGNVFYVRRRGVGLDCEPSRHFGVLGFASYPQKPATKAEGTPVNLRDVASETLKPIRKLIEQPLVDEMAP